MKILQIIAVVFFGTTLLHAERTWPQPAFYKYQVGATFGVNSVSAPLTDFPGTHWGVYMRVDRHTFGFKREWDGEFVKLWGEPCYYERAGAYYGWTASKQHVQWGPQIGCGRIIYNRATTGAEPAKPLQESFYGEIAVAGLVNVRGNGVGGKVFFNANRFSPMVGVTVYAQLGYAWNCCRAEAD